jgi:hypothetical protein
MRRTRLCVLVLLVAVLGMPAPAGAHRDRRPKVVTVLDNLGDADTTTRLTVAGRDGISIAFDQSVGLRFEVIRPTVITEVGGFVETFGVGDPRAADVLVEIHPAHPDGRPNRDTVLASASIAPRPDVSVITYQAASLRVLLRPGLYYALFAADEDAPPGVIDVIAVGSGLRIVGDGVVPYAAPTVIGGVTHPDNYDPSIRELQTPLQLAQLVRGVLLPATRHDCRQGRWKTFADAEGNPLHSAAHCLAVLAAGA